MAGTPNYPKNIGDSITELGRKAAAAYTSSNTRKALVEIRASVLELFGDLIIRPGGRLIAKYLNGADGLTVGAITLSDGTPVHGFLIRRPAGELAFFTYGLDTGGSSFWALYDKQSNIIMSDDAQSGQGLATPYIGWTVTPWSEVLTPPWSTTAATWTILHRAHAPKQHPRVKALLIIQTDADTSGQVRLRNSGTGDIIAGPLNILPGANTYQALEGPIAGPHMGDVYVEVEAQRTGGTGSIRVGVPYMEGKQS